MVLLIDKIIQRGCSGMNECGAVIDWYWQRKLKYWEKNIIQRGW